LALPQFKGHRTFWDEVKIIAEKEGVLIAEAVEKCSNTA
jgi:predicted DNA-binding ribbon-helix-helix protein